MNTGIRGTWAQSVAQRFIGEIAYIATATRCIFWTVLSCAGLLKRFEGHPFPCTKTLYNMLWSGELPVTPFQLPEALSRRQHGKPRISKRMNGKSIDLPK